MISPEELAGGGRGLPDRHDRGRLARRVGRSTGRRSGRARRAPRARACAKRFLADHTRRRPEAFTHWLTHVNGSRPMNFARLRLSCASADRVGLLANARPLGHPAFGRGYLHRRQLLRCAPTVRRAPGRARDAALHRRLSLDEQRA